MKDDKTNLEKRLEFLKSQYKRLQKNFQAMVENTEEADMMLDWLNEIRKKIAELEEKLKNLPQ